MSKQRETVLTVGAIAFAGYALYYVNKTPGKVVAKQPAQQQRDSGLSSFFGNLVAQANNLGYQTYRVDPSQPLFSGIGSFANTDTSYTQLTNGLFNYSSPLPTFASNP